MVLVFTAGRCDERLADSRIETEAQSEGDGCVGRGTREGVSYRANVNPGSVDVVDFVARVRRSRSRFEGGASGADASSLVAYDYALASWRGDALSDAAAEQ